MTATRWAIATIAAGAVLAVSACSAPPPPPPPPAPPKYTVSECSPALKALNRPVECGVFDVPQDRAAPNGTRVQIPVVIARAASPSPDRPPIFFLHGGPGGAVVSRVDRILASEYGQGLIKTDRDWVFFDQRGTGQSTPTLDCGALSLTDAGIATDADVKALGACVEGLQAKGVDFAHYNAVAIAQDIQDLRAALKIGAFDLYGVSYGARVALAVAQHTPDGVRAIVLDSPFPPEAKGTEQLPRITADLTRRLLRNQTGLADRFADLLATWEKTPPAGVTTDDVGQYLVDSLYDSRGVAEFSKRVTAITRGDVSGVLAYIQDRSVYAEAQNIAHFCKEELPFENVKAMDALAAADPIARAVAGPARRYFEACALVPVGAPDPKEIEPVTAAIPTLFLVAGVDPGCPLEFNEPAAKAMPKAQLVTFEARTHGVTRLSACARTMTLAFLANPDAPVDRACLKTEPAPLL